MPHHIEAETSAEGWAKGVQAIAGNHALISPLITAISAPSAISPDWWRDLDPRRVTANANSLRGVVQMIAPDELLIGGAQRQVVYNRVWTRFDRARAQGIHLSNWRDTYFERLTRGANGLNRLEDIIQKMNHWQGRRVASFYAHTTSNAQDSVVPIGNPCLQYVQFLQRADDKLDLFAVYRNHDYHLKALGNFVGLGRLLAFVARETHQIPGKLICFSSNAYLTKQKKVCQLAQIVLQSQSNLSA